MPKGFAFPVNHHFWVPLRANPAPALPLTGPGLSVFGRLAQGVALERAQAELAAIGQRTAAEFPGIYGQVLPRVAPYTFPVLKLDSPSDWAGIVVMQGLAVSLLVLVCLNVAILVYTRTAMRQAEIGLRTALGASRGRIVMQLFLEALILSFVASLAGVAIAAFALNQMTAATRHIAADLPFWISFELRPEGVLYAGALSVLAAAVAGAVPALRATRRQVRAGLRLGKTWTILIAGQAGFAVAVLPPSVLHAWDTARAALAGPGFAASEFLSARIGMESGANLFPARQRELMRRLENEPQVSGVTFAMSEPGDEHGAGIETQIGVGRIHEVRFNRVDPGFFRTFEVPVLAGRGLDPPDTGAATVVVNQPLAQRLFGGNALGQRIRYVGDGDSAPWYEVAGIVSDFPAGVSPNMKDSELKVYHVLPAGQVQPVSVLLRTRGAPSSFSQRLREIAVSVDPELYLRDIRSLEEALRKEQWISRLEASVFVGVTLSVLILSAAGIYALMSFTVSQRHKEIGIRMALGASRKRIVADIFSRAVVQVSAGALLGAATCAGFMNASGGGPMRGGSVAVMAGVALAMVVAGFLAALGPARRSLRIQPVEALREQ